MMHSCDQTGVPIHFHSSTTSGSATLMSLRILLRVSPRQSPSSAILCEMSSGADRPTLAPDFFMFPSWKSQIYFISQAEGLASSPLNRAGIHNSTPPHPTIPIWILPAPDHHPLATPPPHTLS